MPTIAIGSGISLDFGFGDMVEMATCALLKFQNRLLICCSIPRGSCYSLYVPSVGECIHSYLADSLCSLKGPVSWLNPDLHACTGTGVRLLKERITYVRLGFAGAFKDD